MARVVFNEFRAIQEKSGDYCAWDLQLSIDDVPYTLTVRASGTILAVWNLPADSTNEGTRAVLYDLATREVLDTLRNSGGIDGLQIVFTSYNAPVEPDRPTALPQLPQQMVAPTADEIQKLLRQVGALAGELEGLAAVQVRSPRPGDVDGSDQRYQEAYEELEALREELRGHNIDLPHENPHRLAAAMHGYLRVHHSSYAAREESIRSMYESLHTAVDRLLVESQAKGQADAEVRVIRKKTDNLAPDRSVEQVVDAEASVFLAHSSADKAFVRKLADDLSARGIAVWIDEAEIRVGDSITQKINEGLGGAHYLAVILSPASVESEWVKKELGAALNSEIRKKQIVVLPVLLAECDIPALIVDKRYADFRADYRRGLADLLAAVRRN